MTRMCPIYDMNRKPMNVGDSFKYQYGRKFESVATIELRDGVEWIRFSDHAQDIPLADFWYAKTDEPISLLINNKQQP